LRRPNWPWGIALLLSLAVGGAVVFYQREVRRPVTIAGLRAGGVPIGGLDDVVLKARLGEIAAREVEQKIVFRHGDLRVEGQRGEVGIQVDVEALEVLAREAGKTGDPLSDLRAWRRARRGELDLAVPRRLDSARAVEFLDEIKELVDRAPRDAHLDLDRHTIAEEQQGLLVGIYETLVRLVDPAQTGASTVELAAMEIPAQVTRKELAGIDISTVVGTWETHYSTNRVDSDRTYNLKVGADHLNGHVLKPHEVFSFNQVVGDRTEKEGYRVAPVIAGGELVDGLAGGMCQIASTLHAAAFFAGLEILSSTPHSRPSAYIPLGLDSTVVYPSTDLKIRNPFDFPLIIHYQVTQGTVKVELLGKERPYQVLFEREILTETQFGTARRSDSSAPAGQKLILQAGYPGYHVTRRRYIFDRGQALPRSLGGPTQPVTEVLDKAKIRPLKEEKWTIHYPATEEIVAFGTGPRKMKPKDPPPSHRIPPVPPSDKPIGRILR
jgi:vancomycin resistance protein YoaR